MDLLQSATTTDWNGSTTFMIKDLYIATSTVLYALVNNLAMIAWFGFLIMATGTFFGITYFFYKRFNRA